VSVFAQFSLVAGYARRSAPIAKIFTIFEGTSEIQRMIIGRAATGLAVR
jgi:alkylation response protein AidB-like acyl-CoA dehydrogenase